MRTWIHDNLCNLTINYDNEQHSQFLRCLALTSLTKVNAEQLMFLLTFHINTNFKRQSHNYPKFPKVKTHNNFWKQILTRRTISVCWNFGDLITITITITLRPLNTKWWMTAFAIHIHTTVLLQYMYFNLLLQYI